MADTVRYGPLAGVAAAATWIVVEPLVARALGTSYTDVRLLGRAVTRRRAWPLVGGLIHLGNGAAFGWVLDRTGADRPWQAVAAAQVENAILWPTLAVVDRIHPDVRSGAWPRLLRSRRVFAQEVVNHLVFGIALAGAARLLDRPPFRGAGRAP
jgi:hypothetical protein